VVDIYGTEQVVQLQQQIERHQFLVIVNIGRDLEIQIILICGGLTELIGQQQIQYGIEVHGHLKNEQ
jgi:hypothetical protein